MRTVHLLLLFALDVYAQDDSGGGNGGSEEDSQSIPLPLSAISTLTIVIPPPSSAISTPSVIPTAPSAILAPQAPPSVISLPGASPTLLIAYPSASPTFSSTSPTLPGANLSHTRPTLSSVSPTFSSASPTLSAPTPSSTSVVGPFQFDPPHNATTCQNALFTWHFASSSAIQLTINITNEQTGLLAPSAGVRYTLSTNVSSDAQAFLWHVVDVPQGWYAAIAFDTQRTSNILAQSSPFFVLNGSDVACLASPSKSEAPSPHLSSSSLAGIVAGLVASVVIIAAVLSVPRLWKTVSIAKAGPRRPAHLF